MISIVLIVGGMALLIYAPAVVGFIALMMFGLMGFAMGAQHQQHTPSPGAVWHHDLMELYAREREATHAAVVARAHHDLHAENEALIELMETLDQERELEAAIEPPAVEIPDDDW